MDGDGEREVERGVCVGEGGRSCRSSEEDEGDINCFAVVFRGIVAGFRGAVFSFC
jgi:hypothetical protein